MTPPPDWFDADEAQQLLRHLEWQPEGFSLLFVFADALPAQWLADWLNAALRPAGLTLQQPTCAQPLADAPDAVVDALMAELGALAQAPGAVWLPLHHHPQHADWDAARQRLLARLNERRFLLERDLPRPLLLVLPANFRPITREIAPDIWHIRVLSQQWRTPALSAAQHWCWEKLPAGFPISRDRQPWMGRAEDADALLHEWKRSQKNEGNVALIETAWQACAALIAAGRLSEAETILAPTLKAVLHNLKIPPKLDQDRSFALVHAFFQFISLATESERWGEVAGVYGLLLGFYKGSVESVGDESSIYLSAMGLYNLGVVNHQLGKPDSAAKKYLLGLALAKEIYSSDVLWVKCCVQSNILYGQAKIATSSGDYPSALSTYQAALAHYEQAITITPSAAPALQRDLALIQVGLADAHMGLQDWPAAEQALAKSVAIFRQLAAAPRAPRHAREDLAIALARQALLPPGDLAPLQEAERILLQLCAEFVEVSAYPRELSAVRELRRLVDAESQPG